MIELPCVSLTELPRSGETMWSRESRPIGKNPGGVTANECLNLHIVPWTVTKIGQSLTGNPAQLALATAMTWNPVEAAPNPEGLSG